MQQNLFSILSEEQKASLTQEERQTLYEIDKKLFPDFDGDSVEQKHKEWLKNKLAALSKEREENERYAKELEKSFV